MWFGDLTNLSLKVVGISLGWGDLKSERAKERHQITKEYRMAYEKQLSPPELKPALSPEMRLCAEIFCAEENRGQLWWPDVNTQDLKVLMWSRDREEILDLMTKLFAVHSRNHWQRVWKEARGTRQARDDAERSHSQDASVHPYSTRNSSNKKQKTTHPIQEKPQPKKAPPHSPPSNVPQFPGLSPLLKNRKNNLHSQSQPSSNIGDLRTSAKRKADDDLREEDDSQQIWTARKIIADTPVEHSTIVVDSSGNGRRLVTKNNDYCVPQVSSTSPQTKSKLSLNTKRQTLHDNRTPSPRIPTLQDDEEETNLPNRSETPKSASTIPPSSLALSTAETSQNIPPTKPKLMARRTGPFLDRRSDNRKDSLDLVIDGCGERKSGSTTPTTPSPLLQATPQVQTGAESSQQSFPSHHHHRLPLSGPGVLSVEDTSESSSLLTQPTHPFSADEADEKAARDEKKKAELAELEAIREKERQEAIQRAANQAAAQPSSSKSTFTPINSATRGPVTTEPTSSAPPPSPGPSPTELATAEQSRSLPSPRQIPIGTVPQDARAQEIPRNTSTPLPEFPSGMSTSNPLSHVKNAEQNERSSADDSQAIAKNNRERERRLKTYTARCVRSWPISGEDIDREFGRGSFGSITFMTELAKLSEMNNRPNWPEVVWEVKWQGAARAARPRPGAQGCANFTKRDVLQARLKFESRLEAEHTGFGVLIPQPQFQHHEQMESMVVADPNCPFLQQAVALEANVRRTSSSVQENVVAPAPDSANPSFPSVQQAPATEQTTFATPTSQSVDSIPSFSHWNTQEANWAMPSFVARPESGPSISSIDLSLPPKPPAPLSIPTSEGVSTPNLPAAPAPNAWAPTPATPYVSSFQNIPSIPTIQPSVEPQQFQPLTLSQNLPPIPQSISQPSSSHSAPPATTESSQPTITQPSVSYSPPPATTQPPITQPSVFHPPPPAQPLNIQPSVSYSPPPTTTQPSQPQLPRTSVSHSPPPATTQSGQPPISNATPTIPHSLFLATTISNQPPIPNAAPAIYHSPPPATTQSDQPPISNTTPIPTSTPLNPNTPIINHTTHTLPPRDLFPSRTVLEPPSGSPMILHPDSLPFSLVETGSLNNLFRSFCDKCSCELADVPSLSISLFFGDKKREEVRQGDVEGWKRVKAWLRAVVPREQRRRRQSTYEEEDEVEVLVSGVQERG